MTTDNSDSKRAHVHKVRQHYRGPLFSFDSEDVTLPNGSRTELAFVRHPGSTAVVPLFDDNTVLMERQYRHAVEDHLLEIPAGTLELGELPLNCARRELEEETGYVAGDFIEISRLLILPAYSDEKIYLYLARDLSLSRQNLDQDEIIEVVKFPLEDTMNMIDDGKIIDALTILALQRTWIYLNQRKRL
jgi:ADP-ribose pyrophosphatase